MKINLKMAIVLSILPLWPQNSFASEAIIQVVDLNKFVQSSQGGIARLYYVPDARDTPCRMEVEIYGDDGRVEYKFLFGSMLNSASRTKFIYNEPIYVNSRPKESIGEKINLGSSGRYKNLVDDFNHYKKFFAAKKMIKCTNGTAKAH